MKIISILQEHSEENFDNERFRKRRNQINYYSQHLYGLKINKGTSACETHRDGITKFESQKIESQSTSKKVLPAFSSYGSHRTLKGV